MKTKQLLSYLGTEQLIKDITIESKNKITVQLYVDEQSKDMHKIENTVCERVAKCGYMLMWDMNTAGAGTIHLDITMTY